MVNTKNGVLNSLIKTTKGGPINIIAVIRFNDNTFKLDIFMCFRV